MSTGHILKCPLPLNLYDYTHEKAFKIDPFKCGMVNCSFRTYIADVLSTHFKNKHYFKAVMNPCGICDSHFEKVESLIEVSYLFIFISDRWIVVGNCACISLLLLTHP
jgi:hypothetical protein